MYLIISNNKIILGACLLKRRLHYPLSSDKLEERTYNLEMIMVNLFSWGEFWNIFIFVLHGYPV